MTTARDLSSSIVLTGVGHWCSELAAGLCQFASLKVGVASFDRASRAFDLSAWRSLVRADVVVVVGFRPGARTVRGIAFDWLFSLVQMSGPRKRIVRYWIGTDAERTARDSHAGRLGPRFRRGVRDADHFAGSAQIADVLKGLGICAEAVDFPWRGMPESVTPPPMPARFTVLSYVPDPRFELYGGPQLLTAARALPEVSFMIVGGEGAWAGDVPDNVRFLGWQKEMASCFAAASCVVRIVEHDSIGATVIEGLAYGRTAVYSLPLEHTIHVPFGDVPRLVQVLGGLEAAYGPEPQPDLVASAWAFEHFDPVRLYGELAERLVERVSGEAGNGAAHPGGRS